MGVTICGSGVKRQLTDKRYAQLQVQEWCGGRISAIDTFIADGSLKGKSWDAAHRRMEDYRSFFECMRYGAEEVGRVDQRVYGLLDSYFGDSTVREDDWIAQRDSAQRHINRYNTLISSAKKDPGDTTKLRKNLGKKRDAWKSKKDAAERMLEKIRKYCAKTDNAYAGSLAGMEKALARGAKQLSNTRFEAGKNQWGVVDDSWKTAMAESCDTGVKRGSDLYQRGPDGKDVLDTETTSRILHKPADLLTEGELLAISEAYEKASKEAVGSSGKPGDASNLNAFLNCCYLVAGTKVTQTGNTSGEASTSHFTKTCSVETTYEMAPTAAAFLTMISDGYNKKAYENLGNLEPWEYLAAGTAAALVDNAQKFTVTEDNISVGDDLQFGRDSANPEFNGENDPSNQQVMERDAALGALQVSGPNVTVEVGQTKELDGRTVRYDDISFGERPRKSGNDVSTADIVLEDDPLGKNEKKHIYLFRDNGSATDNINAQNMKDAIDNYEGKVKERDEYWQREAVKRGEKALKKQIKKIVEIDPGVKTVSKVIETTYDTVKDINDTIEGYEDAKKAVDTARDDFAHQADIADQYNYAKNSGIDNGSVYWCPDTNQTGISCAGYDRKDDGAGRRATYERNRREYEAAVRGEGRNDCYQGSFNDWMNERA